MMSYASTGVNNAGLADDYVSPTTDVWSDEYDRSRDWVETTWLESGLKTWADPILRNMSAFEAIDATEKAVLDEINNDLRKMLENPSFPERSAWLLGYIGCITETLSYSPFEKRHRLSHQQICFFSDFYDIRECVRYVMGSTPVSSVEWERAPQSEQTVPITIHPGVIREAEEKTLTNDLEVSIELARETYPTLSKIELRVEDDPEIIDRRTIRFTLSVSGNPETILQNEGLFKQRLCSSTTPRARELITITYRWDK